MFKLYTPLFFLVAFVLNAYSGDKRSSTIDTATIQICEIEVFRNQNLDGDQIGSFKVNECNSDSNCNYSQIMKSIQLEGCRIGANRIVLTKIKEPESKCPCYQISGKYLIDDEVPSTLTTEDESASESDTPSDNAYSQKWKPKLSMLWLITLPVLLLVMSSVLVPHY